MCRLNGPGFLGGVPTNKLIKYSIQNQFFKILSQFLCDSDNKKLFNFTGRNVRPTQHLGWPFASTMSDSEKERLRERDIQAAAIAATTVKASQQ